MKRRTAYMIEAGVWLAVMGLAFAFGLLVAPGNGREIFAPIEPAKLERLECVAWTEMEQREVPTGRLMGVVRYCREYANVQYD